MRSCRTTFIITTVRRKNSGWRELSALPAGAGLSPGGLNHHKKPLALFSEIYYYMICAWGYSSEGERSVRIRKAVSSNLIISIKQPASSGRLLSKITSYVCSSVDRALDSGSRCAGSIPVRRAHGDMHSISPFYVFTSGTPRCSCCAPRGKSGRLQ